MVVAADDHHDLHDVQQPPKLGAAARANAPLRSTYSLTRMMPMHPTKRTGKEDLNQIAHGRRRQRYHDGWASAAIVNGTTTSDSYIP